MKIVTSLSFQGQCREAFEFYAKVLGGKIKAAIPYSDAPPGMPITDEKYKSWLLHCWLDAGDQSLMGADMDVGWAHNIDKPKNGFDVTLHTEDKAEARRWFDQLSEGGKAIMPFGETFWSPGFGSLIDKFGIPWMVNTIPSADWKPPHLASGATPAKITVETTVAASIEEVWRAYTTPGDIKQWNAASPDWHTTAASVDLREGGRFSSRMEAKDGSMGFDFAGTYTRIVDHKLIEYAFGDRAAQVTFTPATKGVTVRVTFDSEPMHSIEQQRTGWQAILDNFAKHVAAKRARA